jgi:hypothetical protein
MNKLIITFFLAMTLFLGYTGTTNADPATSSYTRGYNAGANNARNYIYNFVHKHCQSTAYVHTWSVVMSNTIYISCNRSLFSQSSGFITFANGHIPTHTNYELGWLYGYRTVANRIVNYFYSSCNNNYYIVHISRDRSGVIHVGCTLWNAN